MTPAEPPILAKIAALHDNDIKVAFMLARWPNTEGQPCCGKPGHIGSYLIARRGVFRCRTCRRDFTVLSETLFANSKQSLRSLLIVAALWCAWGGYRTGSKIARASGISHKAVWVLLHKFDELNGSEFDANAPRPDLLEFLRRALRARPSANWRGYWDKKAACQTRRSGSE